MISTSPCRHMLSQTSEQSPLKSALKAQRHNDRLTARQGAACTTSIGVLPDRPRPSAAMPLKHFDSGIVPATRQASAASSPKGRARLSNQSRAARQGIFR